MKKQIILVMHYHIYVVMRNERIAQKELEYPNEPYHVLLAMTRKEDDEKEKKEQEKVKKPTLRERARIKTLTKMKRAELFTVPPPPYVNIVPAPGLRKKNYVDIVSYVNDKYPRIEALTEFDNVSPSVNTVQGISDALSPLADLGRGDINSAQKRERDTLYNQLIEYFTSMINDCANLSGGNVLLFLLTGVATKRSPVRNRQQLAATVFKLNLTKGGGKVGVSCKAIKYAKSYTVYYGPGSTYDAATWKSKVGTSRILITGLTPGTFIGFVMVANTGTTEGLWANIQTTNVPFN